MFDLSTYRPNSFKHFISSINRFLNALRKKMSTAVKSSDKWRIAPPRQMQILPADIFLDDIDK